VRQHLPLFASDSDARWLAEAVAVRDGTTALVVGTEPQHGAGQRSGFLWLVDTSVPEELVFSPPVTLSGYPTAVQLTADYAYVTSQNNTLTSGGLDIIATQPVNAPLLVGTVSNDRGAGAASAQAVAVDAARNIAHVAGLGVVDVQDPAAPVLLTTAGPGERAVRAVQVVGDILYMLTFDGLLLLDISNPAAPTLFDQQRAPLDSFDLAVGVRWAFIGADRGLSVYDPTPFQLAEVSRQGGTVRDLVLADGLVYAGGGAAQAVHVLAVPPDGQPTRLTTISTNDFVYDVQLSGDALAVGLTFRLTLLQRDAGHSLPPLGAYPVDRLPWALQIVGERGYLLELAGDAQLTTLHVLDLSDRTAPTAISVTALAQIGYFTDLAVVGTTVYLIGPAGAAGQLTVLDLSNPTQPREIGGLALDNRANSITVTGNRAYIGGEQGLTLVDISDPTAPMLLGLLPTGELWDVAVAGEVAYLAAATEGVLVADISDPTTPGVLTQVLLPGRTTELLLTGDLLYAAAGTGGLQIVQLVQQP
jgi:hypothetical protein